MYYCCGAVWMGCMMSLHGKMAQIGKPEPMSTEVLMMKLDVPARSRWCWRRLSLHIRQAIWGYSGSLLKLKAVKLLLNIGDAHVRSIHANSLLLHVVLKSVELRLHAVRIFSHVCDNFDD